MKNQSWRNVRRLRGIYFIEPEDEEFKEIIKNVRKKLEVPAAPAMPCKRTNGKHGVTRSKSDDHKSRLTCILEAEESKRLRTSRPDHLWPELWKSMGKHAKLKEKQKWSEEKLHLENARKLRGICFIDPEDTNSKKPSRTRVRSWKHQWLLLCPAKF